MGNVYTVYAVGCDSENGGIATYRLSEDGRLTETDFLPLDRPTYLIRDGEMHHVLLRNPYGEDGESGFISLSRTAHTADLSAVRPTGGLVACHLTKLDGRLYGVNYTSGSITEQGGKTVQHPRKPGMRPGRQDGPHAHCVIPSPDGRYLLCTDLGLDRVYVYTKDLDVVSYAEAPAGHGPRHLICHPNGKYVYCLNELASTLTVYAYADGRLTRGKTYSCHTTAENNLAAAIRLTHDARRLYASQRGDQTISVFDVSEEGGELIYAGAIPCYGDWPRDIFLTPDERFLLCANQYSGTVTVLRLDGGLNVTLTDTKTLKNALCVTAE